MRVVNGMHISNTQHWHIEQMLRIAKDSGAVTILHFMMFPRDTMSDGVGDVENAYWYGKLRWGWPAQHIPPAPERLIHIRLFQANWSDWDPKEIARRAVPLLRNWQGGGRSADLWLDPLVCVSPCNEQNLEGPTTGWWGLGETQRAALLDAWASWQLRFWDEVDRLCPDRRAPSVIGALAYGGDWKHDVPDSEYQHPRWRELCQRVDILATHPYAHLDRPDGMDTIDPERTGYWHLLRDFRPKAWRDTRQPGRPPDPGGILAQVLNKPLLMTEAGTFVHGDVHRTQDTLAAMRRLLEASAKSQRVLGVTWFIWNSGPEHAGNRIWYNESLRNGMEAAIPAYETSASVPAKGTGGSAVEKRFWPILAAHAARAGVGADDLRATLASKAPFGALTLSRVEAVVAHHTAAPEATIWDSVANYHVHTRGFSGIGYHVGVRAGRIAYLGDLDTARAHVANENHRYLGLCMAGNYEDAAPSEANMRALGIAYDAMREWLGRDVPLRPHRDVAPPGYTVCCGKHLIARLGELEAGGIDLPALKEAAQEEHRVRGIRYNPEAALARAMQADGVWPTTNEFDAAGVVAQRAEGSSGVWVYWWTEGRVRKAAL